MPIPPLIHQTWKTSNIPLRWRHLVDSVKRNHPEWTYHLWSDEEMEAHVLDNHPALYPVYMAFEKNVMRADVFRYVVMHDLGGLYCDLDYEFLRPYPYGEAELVLMEESSEEDGGRQIANYVFASAPGHRFWKDVLDDLVRNPPIVTSANDVTGATGPGLISRIFFAGEERYEGLVLNPKQAFSPPRARGRNESARMIASGAYGIHHAWGSWKERTVGHYLRKAARLFDKAD